MKRVLIVLDHYETDMFKVRNKQVENNFTHSVVGKILKNKIINHPRTGIDTRNCILDIKFLYTKGVPHKNQRTNTYSKPPAKVLHSQAEVLLHHIKETKPDIIISYGAWFADEIVRRYKIDKAKMELIPLDLDGFKTYAFFGPNLKQINLMGSYERDKLLIGNRMVNRFIKGGIENTKPQFGKYKLITDYNEVVHIFKDVLPKYPIIALDFETNTLQTYLKGAKAIMVSMSWKEHQGISIPLSHRLSPELWTKEQFNSIIELIKQLMMSNQPKVLHNSMYDIHMMMDIYGLEYARNCRDTMLMYYETVDESQGAPRGLKHLAYKYTDMGGYEDERDRAFEKYLADDYQHWYDTEMKKYEAGEIKKKPLKSHYVAPTNPVDGSKIDFEWLPMETVYKYAAADTDVTLQLYRTFDKLVQTRPKWSKLCYDYFPKMCDVLAYMQHTGFQIDRNKLSDYRKHFVKDINDVVDQMRESVPEITDLENERLAKIQKREEIKAIKPKDRTPEQKKLFKDYAKITGKDKNGVSKYRFNPGSSKDIGYILFELMGYELPAEKDYLKPKAVQQRKMSKPETLTWEDYKTDRQVVLPYIKKHYHEKFADLLLRYSTDKKMLSSTVDGYGKLLDDTGKLHGQFKLDGTVTSRLASKAPNLQNIHKPTSNVNDPNYNYSAKGLFVSRFKGGYIFNIDYKSLEFFVASLITKDQGMMQALMDGTDIHKRNASIAFNIPYDEVDPTHRQLAKAVGFGDLLKVSHF